MKNPNVIEEGELSMLTGYKQGADIARNLREQGIVVFSGKKGKVWTTIQLINAAGGLNPE